MSEHVGVVGAGVFGAWTAVHLQRAGHQVTLVDAHGPAHSRASSGGESRLIRAAYGRDAIYTRMARDSLAEWQKLSAVFGLPILHRCGVLFFFAAEEPYLQDTIVAHCEAGLSTEVLDADALTRRFPMIDFEGIELGLLEPDFGVLMARRAVQTLVGRFVAAGGTYMQGLVQASAGNALSELRLASGETIGADRFVFAAGPWLPKLFPDVVGRRIRVTRQEVFYFEPPRGDPRFGSEAMPGWVDFFPHLAIDGARTLERACVRRRELERRLVVHHRTVLAEEEILAELTELEEPLRLDLLRLELFDFALELFDQVRPATRRPQPLLDVLAEFHVRLSSHTHRGIRRNKAASVITCRDASINQKGAGKAAGVRQVSVRRRELPVHGDDGRARRGIADSP